MRPKIYDAVKSLNETTAFSITDNKLDGWDIAEVKTGATRPTDNEIATELTRLQTEYDAQEYARNRAAEYPSIADQLDDIYHNGIDDWKATIKTTKDKYPKP